jgi:chemotaxis protein MotB
MNRSLAAALMLTLTSGACVTARTHDRTVAELDATRRQDAEAARVAAARIAALDEQAALLAGRLERTTRDLKDITTERDEARRDLDGSIALVNELKKRLERLGQDVGKLTGERGDLMAALAVTRGRLDELRRQADAAEARAQLFRSLVQRFHAMIDAGKLSVRVREGRMLIALPTDILFDSGRTQVKPEAEATLAEVAKVLRDIKDRKFLVVGHTDDVPIHTARFSSNWELSAGRAIAVTHVLMAKGVAPRALGIGGQGEFDPAAANDTDENRARNRRIEIVVEPNLSELPTLDVHPAVSLEQR